MVLLLCVDGLTGFPATLETVFPQTQVQLCLVPKVRHSLAYVASKDRRAVAEDLKAIYTAPTREGAEQALEVFAETGDGRYPAISSSWPADWDRLTPLFEYPPAIRRVIYTTHAIASLNRSLRRVLKTRTVSMASGKPVSPSTPAIKPSCIPRLFSAVSTESQHLAPSVGAIHSPQPVKNKTDLNKRLESALKSLQRQADRVRSFFQLPETQYAAGYVR